MAFSQDGVLGIDLNNVVTAVNIAARVESPTHNLGTVVNGNDGKLYVYARANATIAANTAVCTVNATTFLATATGGAYLSPTTGMVTGDFGWFSKALV